LSQRAITWAFLPAVRYRKYLKCPVSITLTISQLRKPELTPRCYKKTEGGGTNAWKNKQVSWSSDLMVALIKGLSLEGPFDEQ